MHDGDWCSLVLVMGMQTTMAACHRHSVVNKVADGGVGIEDEGCHCVAGAGVVEGEETIRSTDIQRRTPRKNMNDWNRAKVGVVVVGRRRPSPKMPKY
jgi:hypothetical protein